MSERPELLTTAQVLEILQIGRTKLWALVRNNAFPAYRIGDGPNGRLRYRRSEVMSWLELQRISDFPSLEKPPRHAAEQ